MSAAPARQARPIPHSHAPRSAPQRHLRAVAAPEQARSLVPFALLCATIVVVALAAVLMLNTAMASGAYERRALKIEIADLHGQRTALVTELERQAAPERLSEGATALGMQPAEVLGFISLGDSVVIESKER